MKVPFFILFYFVVLSVNAQDTINVLSFNDFHGTFIRSHDAPGAGALLDMLSKEKQKNDIVVSVGDNFSGTYFSNITRGECLYELFREMDVEVSAIGNHEFDWGQDYFIESSLKIKYVAANITSGKLTIAPYHITERRLKTGKIFKIAFIGLTTITTPAKSAPENVAGVNFHEARSTPYLKKLCDMKRRGEIDMIIVLAHTFAEELPFTDGIDAIIMGHTHEVIQDKFHGIPIIQAGFKGMYLGKLSFEIDGHQVNYLGGKVLRNVGTASVTESDFDDYIVRHKLNEKLTVATTNLLHVRNQGNTDIGKSVTRAYVYTFKKKNSIDSLTKLPVVGLNHFGGIRANIPKGTVTRMDAGNVLPFCGQLVAYRLCGVHLKYLLKMGLSQKSVPIQYAGIEVTTENDEIVKITSKGKEIRDDMPCVVVMDIYIAKDGDEYLKAIFKNAGIDSFNDKGITTTSAFIEYLKSLRRVS